MNTRFLSPIIFLVAIAGVAGASPAHHRTTAIRDTAANTIYAAPAQKPEDHILVGYIREAKIGSARDKSLTPYLYLHLMKPVNIVNNKGSLTTMHKWHVYDIQLVGGGPAKMVSKLKQLVGDKVSLDGVLPFRCEGSCRGIVPLEPVMAVVRIIGVSQMHDRKAMTTEIQ